MKDQDQAPLGQNVFHYSRPEYEQALGDQLRRKIQDAPPGAVIELKPLVHRISEPLMIERPLMLTGTPEKTVVVSSAFQQAMICQLKADERLVLRGLALIRLGGLFNGMVEVSGGEVDITHCRFFDLPQPNVDRFHGCALRLSGALTGTVADCVVTEAAYNAIEVRGSAQPRLWRNLLYKNAGSGLVYYNEAGGSAVENNCSKNGGHGILLCNRAHPTLENNICEQNKKDGIAYQCDGSAGSDFAF